VSEIKMKCEIQRADYSDGADIGSVDLLGAELAYRNHDWASEFALKKNLMDQGKDYCPPNILFHRDAPDLSLQFCPNEDGSANCVLHEPLTARQIALGEHVKFDNEAGSYEVILIKGSLPEIHDAPVLLQYRLLQLFFRDDLGDLFRAFDEFGTPGSSGTYFMPGNRARQSEPGADG